MNARHICIHGHFYQPPRENPWLEAIEVQDSAYPYHDWNRRIAAECYSPNAASRILDERGYITRIVNNYARISFNFGPTLLSWLENHERETYGAILEADRLSRERFSGHGSALAQVYNHTILPLATERDRRTQVAWGIRDFERRFGRRPEGMWLAETAVDLASLDLLAAHGIRFTILAPSQSTRWRLAGGRWREGGPALPTTRPYGVSLPSGREIAVFFYDGPTSRAVAFERLLSEGEKFASRLLAGFDDDDEPQLVHIATDGETYGHHHRHGDMALAYALHHIEERRLARLTNYGEYLSLYPPRHEAEIVEGSSWSCAHGLGRWSRDCGCRTDDRPGWNQAWRGPLRDALDGVRDAVNERFERDAEELFEDPWAAREAYIDVILDRSPESVDAFLARHARGALSDVERSRALKLMELQRQLQLMYTSCGWFFDEVSGIETIQVLRYAGRAVELAQDLFDLPLEHALIERLEATPSNLAEYASAATIYERQVRPARIDLAKAGANFAAGMLFGVSADTGVHGGFHVECAEHSTLRSGPSTLLVGRLRVASRVTLEQAAFGFAFVHLGDHNLIGGVRGFAGQAAYEAMVGELRDAFSGASLPEVLKLLQREFEGSTYTLETLLRDTRRSILERVLDARLTDVEAVFDRIYRQHVPLMRFLKGLDNPLPAPLKAAAEVVLNRGLRRELAAVEFDPERLADMLDEADRVGVELDGAGLGFAAQSMLERLLRDVEAQPNDAAVLERLRRATSLIRSQTFEIDLQGVETGYYRLLVSVAPSWRERSDGGDAAARHWLERFDALGELLRVAARGSR